MREPIPKVISLNISTIKSDAFFIISSLSALCSSASNLPSPPSIVPNCGPAGCSAPDVSKDIT